MDEVRRFVGIDVAKAALDVFIGSAGGRIGFTEDLLMPTLSLPQDQTAILVMDCQNDIVDENGKLAATNMGAMVRVIREKHLLRTIARLAAAGRAARLPIIHVRHAYRPDYADAPRNIRLLRGARKAQSLMDGSWGAEIHPELKPEPQDIVITKTRVSSFFASPLEAILTAQGITHLVLTGVATDGVVEGTARDGADRGYNIVIPEDCCVGTTEEAHRVILGGVLAKLTTVCKADDVIKALQSR
jgi:nicotinamidase-related amidase